MLQFARFYGDLGWLTIPLYDVVDDRCACSQGEDCPAPGKHPRITAWQTNASSDQTMIEHWWNQWPQANVGLLTGHDRAVIDIDRRHGGDDALAELESMYGSLPDTLTTLTGDGEHRHFSISSPLQTGTIAPGVEIKASGAMVILPPSLHHTGHRYAWEASCHPAETRLAPLPAWITERLKQSRPDLKAGWAADWLRTPMEPGGRRGPDGIPRIVGYLRGHGADCETAIAIVEMWDAQNPVPLGTAEVRRHVTGMYERYGIPPVPDPASKSARTVTRKRRSQVPTIALERGLVIVRE